MISIVSNISDKFKSVASRSAQTKEKLDGNEPKDSEFYKNLIEVQTFVKQGADTAAIPADRKNKQEIFKNCAPFTDCIIYINNKQADNAKEVIVVKAMYNLIEYSDTCCIKLKNDLFTTSLFYIKIYYVLNLIKIHL